MDDPLAHEALVYRDGTGYVTGLLPFLHAALARDEPVLVAVPPAGIDLLRDGLGGDAPAVRFVDMCGAGHNPTAILPAVLSVFADRHPGRRVTIVGEPIWAGRPAAAYSAAVQHEALINLAFAGRPATIVCPYDSSRLHPDAIADARRTHPVVVDGGTRRASPDYADPAAFAASCLHLPAAPPTAARFDLHGPGELAGLRGFVLARAIQAGLGHAAAADLRLAAHEVATNALAHAGGPVTVLCWPTEDTVVCEVRDQGRAGDRLLGRRPVGQLGRPDQHGRGLALANQLCDLVQIDVQPTGTTIRLHRGGTPPNAGAGTRATPG